MSSFKKSIPIILLLTLVLGINACKKVIVTTTTTTTNTTKPLFFEKYIGSETLNDRGNAAIINQNNNVIIVGEMEPSGGQKEVLLVELDKEGNELMNEHIKVGTNDIGSAVLETTDGYLIVGQTAQNLGPDILLLKVDRNGNKEWTKVYKSAQYEWAVDVAEHNNNFYVLCSAEDSTMPGRDMLLLKVDVQGDLIWSKKYGGSGDDAAWGMLKDREGNLLLVGHTYSYGFGNRDAWLIKVDANGNELWKKTYGGGDYDEGMAITQLSSGDYVLVGHSASVHPEHHLYTTRIDINGNIVWERHLGGIKHDGGEAVGEDSNGNILLLGRSNSFDNYEEQAYFIKLDPNGIVLDEQHFMGQGKVRGDCILEHDQSYWLIGTTTNTTNNLSDVWVNKIDKK
ncbi:MAG: hypothetical protein GY810_18850 [Aureispira sp.]|nr:hypothetical protein [Aureispira sp.]